MSAVGSQADIANFASDVSHGPQADVHPTLSGDSAIARRDTVIGQYLIDANIRLMLLAEWFFRNATRARHNLRVKK
jgi:hypothetical protein